jgi:hypothetical protein
MECIFLQKIVHECLTFHLLTKNDLRKLESCSLHHFVGFLMLNPYPPHCRLYRLCKLSSSA